MLKFEPGTIVEVVFPFEEGKASKRRPALVLKDDGDTTFIVAKITSQNKGRRWDVHIPRNSVNGLSIDSFIQVDKVIKLSKEKVCSLIPRGSIAPLQLAVIIDKLREFRESKLTRS